MSDAVILTGDVRDVLPTLPLASFDVAIADPAYGETSIAWDKRLVGWPALVRPLLKPHGSLWCFGSLRSFWKTREDFEGWNLAQDLIWEKQNGSGFCKDRFKRVHEQLAHLYPADSRWRDLYRSPQTMTVMPRAGGVNRSRSPAHRGAIGSSTYEFSDKVLQRSVVYEPNCHGHAINPTQKPLGIQQLIIRYSCPPGGNVLVLFAGSGSTCIAARAEGCDSLGVEIDPAMADKARAAIAAAPPPAGPSAAPLTRAAQEEPK